ncbi:MAG: beta-hydroxyacyl-ACP dehydratase [Planctomycetaceae bacterium]|nr:beta-hydroxyacyl-ACP dehydratase [Planctomycetaceae bacterium]
MPENHLQPILDRIPHRPPFLFLDEIREYEPGRLVCLKTFREDEPFFQGHYPGFPLVPGVLLCEATMQAGALLLAKMFEEEAAGDGSLLGKMPVVAKMGEVRFKQMIRPGDTIRIEVKFKEKMTSIYFLHGKVTCDEKMVLQFEFACKVEEKN